jgi:hypothetical protein
MSSKTLSDWNNILQEKIGLSTSQFFFCSLRIYCVWRKVEIGSKLLISDWPENLSQWRNFRNLSTSISEYLLSLLFVNLFLNENTEIEQFGNRYRSYLEHQSLWLLRWSGSNRSTTPQTCGLSVSFVTFCESWKNIFEYHKEYTKYQGYPDCLRSWETPT